jgi:hypothetical protein
MLFQCAEGPQKVFETVTKPKGQLRLGEGVAVINTGVSLRKLQKPAEWSIIRFSVGCRH